MSDDEDEFDENGKKTQRYISHAPLYRSAEVWKLSINMYCVTD
jgi:hypothetical protein